MKPKVFIVEDDPTIVELLQVSLADTFKVSRIMNFRAVVQEIVEASPDLVLMDLNLPYFNGFYWTTELRKQSDVPILFISSQDDEMNMVMAMDMGADDYIPKPFQLSVLRAKMQAILRRRGKGQLDGQSYGEYHLSLDGILKNKSGQELMLTRTENTIMQLLFHASGVVKKEEVLEKLWHSDAFIDANTLNVTMSRLRKKLAEIAFYDLQTVKGVGYKLEKLPD